MDDLDTRGGPPIVKPANRNMNFGFGSDSRKRWSIGANFQASREDEGGWNLSLGPNVRVQPRARLQASVSANYTAGVDSAQWIKTVDVDMDGTDDHIYGRLSWDS